MQINLLEEEKETHSREEEVQRLKVWKDLGMCEGQKEGPGVGLE